MNIIKWCNENIGFLTAILSSIGLIISTIAIITSIRAAKLPYKKAIKLSISYNIAFGQNPLTNEAFSEIIGITVNAINVGTIKVNIVSLCLAIRAKTFGYKPQMLTKTREQMTGTGILDATEICSNNYAKNDLLYSLTQVESCAKVFVYARDSEGKEYYRRAGDVATMIKCLQK